MPRWLRHHLLIVALATPVLFFRLGDARLWDRDEPRNAQCAVEMLARGDWGVPYFNGELRTHKPVLLYWLILSAYGMFGVNEFAARFWSAALGLGTVLCTYHLGARLFSPKAGLWGALALAPALMLDVASRAATPDGALIFCLTATLCAYVLFAFPAASDADAQPQFSRSVWAGIVVYGLMALAVLAKGPVGVVVPLSVMTLSLWSLRTLAWEGCAGTQKAGDRAESTEWVCMLRIRLVEPLRNLVRVAGQLQPLTAMVMLLLIAAPWYVWVGWQTRGEFLLGFFWDHNVRRATEAMEGHSGPAILFYPLTVLVGFFPASVFLMPSLLQARRQSAEGPRQAAAILFCISWIVVVVGLFSLAKTKLPSYVTPCYPALAVLVGNVVERWTAGRLLIAEGWLRWSLVASLASGVGATLGIKLVADRLLPGDGWLALIPLVLIVGGGSALVCEAWLGWRQQAAIAHFAAALLFSCLLFGLGPAAADRHQQSHLLLGMLRAAEPQEIGAWRCLEPSWVFYLGRPIRELEEWRDAAEFLSHDQRALIVRAEDYPVLAGHLPADVEVAGETERFLRDEKLLTLVRRSPAISKREPDAARR